MDEIKILEHSNGITLECRVTPRAGRNAIKYIKNGILMIALKSPPIEGKANEDLIKYMAKILSIRKSDIIIKSGIHSRNKILLIHEINKVKAIAAIESSIKK